VTPAFRGTEVTACIGVRIVANVISVIIVTTVRPIRWEDAKNPRVSRWSKRALTLLGSCSR